MGWFVLVVLEYVFRSGVPVVGKVVVVRTIKDDVSEGLEWVELVWWVVLLKGW